MRLSYHGWAATLLILSSVLVAGGIALGITPSSPVSTLPNGDAIAISCGSPWAPGVAETAQCAAGFGARGTMGLLLIGSGLLLFGAQLLVGMAIAGVRDAIATAQQQVAVTTAGPEPGHPAPQA